MLLNLEQNYILTHSNKFDRTQIKECKAANAFTQIALPLAQVISGFIFTHYKNSSGWQDAIQFSAILLFVVGYLSLAALEYLSKSYSKSREYCSNYIG